ncbi:hypothetical protein FRC10_011605 [Ceratobasidium sp. 414]|nr:hypothetical protein FRC10_011605 [Ceratobasidium sp. 414]
MFKGNKVYVGTSFSISLSPSRLRLSSSSSLAFFISRLLHLSPSSSLAFFISRLLHLSSRGKLSVPDFRNTMFPQPVNHATYRYPQDGLLQAYGVVQDNEIATPSTSTSMNGLATGTTVGRANGLESFTRTYPYGIKHTSIEIAVLPYDNTRGKFSDNGDSGSIVLARDGRIVGILTGGAGPADETDITYLTPYWWVEKQIKAKFPDSFLYDVIK